MVLFETFQTACSAGARRTAGKKSVQVRPLSRHQIERTVECIRTQFLVRTFMKEQGIGTAYEAERRLTEMDGSQFEPETRPRLIDRMLYRGEPRSLLTGKKKGTALDTWLGHMLDSSPLVADVLTTPCFRLLDPRPLAASEYVSIHLHLRKGAWSSPAAGSPRERAEQLIDDVFTPPGSLGRNPWGVLLELRRSEMLYDLDGYLTALTVANECLIIHALLKNAGDPLFAAILSGGGDYFERAFFNIVFPEIADRDSLEGRQLTEQVESIRLSLAQTMMPRSWGYAKFDELGKINTAPPPLKRGRVRTASNLEELRPKKRMETCKQSRLTSSASLDWCPR